MALAISLLFSLLIASSSILLSNMRPAEAHGKHPTPTPTISITKFGAVGDGKTDDTAAIKAAIKAGGKSAHLTAPAGTFCYSAPLIFPSGITLAGVSRATTTFKPTVAGAGFVLTGSSALSNLNASNAPGDSGYNYPGQDLTPGNRTVYAAPGANITLTDMNAASIVGIDCASIHIQDSYSYYSDAFYGCRNIVIKGCSMGAANPNGGGGLGCTVCPDDSGRESLGLALSSCSFPNLYVDIGGAVAKSGTQSVTGCTFANTVNSGVTIIIGNDNSVASTNFSFTGNTITGTAAGLYLLNYNPHVNVAVSTNKLHNAPSTSTLQPAAFLESSSPSQTVIGKITFSSNDVWAPVVLGGSLGPFTGGVSITKNTFSQLGSISWSDFAIQWAGPLTISNNTFTYTGTYATYFGTKTAPVLLQIPTPYVTNVASLVTIENNTCTSSAALPGFVIVLAPSTYTTNLNGNNTTPAGAVNTVVNTAAALQTLLTQLY